MPLELSIGHATHAGQRERNEDFCGIVTPEGAELAARGAVLAVADGVSGDGDSASIGLGGFIHTLRRNLPMVYIVENNGEVVITQNGKPLARLEPVVPKKKKRIAGLNRGMIWTSEDFDEPLPDEFWLGKE